MQVVNEALISHKKVLLRYDIDVALRFSQGKPIIVEEFKLKAGLETLKLCIQNASKVIIVGHLGRPFKTAGLSAKPIAAWFEKELGIKVLFASTLQEAQNSTSQVVLLENIRFFHGEIPGAEYHATCVSKTCDIDFAKQLAELGDFYVNEAFSSYNQAASTTIVPTLLPHAAGIHFIKEVETLLKVRNNPKKPLIVIMGGAKVADKMPVIQVMAQIADAVLVGGKIAYEISKNSITVGRNVMVGKLSEKGTDIATETTASWKNLIMHAQMIVWNGPLGKFEDAENNQTEKVIQMVLETSAEIIIGGGDSVAALDQYGLLKKAESKSFVSVGGGAMLKLLSDGTLPTIEALK